MASRPGLLTDWPWKSLGNFKVCVYKFYYMNVTICSIAVHCVFAQIRVYIKDFFDEGMYMYNYMFTDGIFCCL